MLKDKYTVYYKQISYEQDPRIMFRHYHVTVTGQLGQCPILVQYFPCCPVTLVWEEDIPHLSAMVVLRAIVLINPHSSEIRI